MKKILSIDGGGIKGVFPASFLASIEDSVGQPIYKYFDIITGTSTGGIIALGLGLGISAKEILKFYEDEGERIFKYSKYKQLLSYFFTKHKDENLIIALKKVFENKKLGESKVRLVIPTFNLENGTAYVYKTAHHERFEKDYKERILDIALATSAAPTYLPIFKSKSGIRFIDGGIGANNPTALGIVEALGVMNWNLEELRVLSLGCTIEAFPININSKNIFSGKLYYANKLLDLFMFSQSSYSEGIAKILLKTSYGNGENYIRVNPLVAKDKFKLDKSNKVSIEALKALGNTEARDKLSRLRRIFFCKEAEEFRPYYSL